MRVLRAIAIALAIVVGLCLIMAGLIGLVILAKQGILWPTITVGALIFIAFLSKWIYDNDAVVQARIEAEVVASQEAWHGSDGGPITAYTKAWNGRYNHDGTSRGTK